MLCHLRSFLVTKLKFFNTILPSNPNQISALIHEAKFYGIAPLAKQLSMCKDVGKSNCGNILFCGKLDPPKSNHQAVKLIKAHYSTIVVAYDDHFACYQHKGMGPNHLLH